MTPPRNRLRDPSLPLPRIRLTSPNYPLTSPNSPSPRLLQTVVRLDPTTRRLLHDLSEKWAERNLPTSGLRHRPPVLSAYISDLVRKQALPSHDPRAYKRGSDERKTRYARAVAPWDPSAHRYDGPPKVPRPRLSLKRSLLTSFPKEGDTTLRERAYEALQMRIVASVEDRQVLDPGTVSRNEVGRLSYFKPADAERVCGGTAA